jgi:hypothetical protein
MSALLKSSGLWQAGGSAQQNGAYKSRLITMMWLDSSLCLAAFICKEGKQQESHQ